MATNERRAKAAIGIGCLLLCIAGCVLGPAIARVTFAGTERMVGAGLEDSLGEEVAPNVDASASAGSAVLGGVLGSAGLTLLMLGVFAHRKKD